ncbi:MAG: hypothetical protein BalsKO_09050 [Balneolaceae bacterium]
MDFVFKLEEKDFPIYAGDWFSIAQGPNYHKFICYSEFIKEYGKYFGDKKMSLDANEESQIDYQDFEIIIPNRIEADRIIKVIKDRIIKKK